MKNMRYSALAAPIACSLALHIAVLNFGWEIFASDAGISAPWRRPALHATLVAAATPVPANPVVLPPVAPAASPRLARAESTPKPKPQVTAAPAQAGDPTPAPAAAEPAPEAAPADPTQPAEMPDSAFMDQGGVDEVARPLVEPDYYPPSASRHWVVEFDLLIDATGKAVRVDNVSTGTPREIVGAVLAAFYTIPYEPAKLAGQPVAIRQRFSVQPFPGPLAGASPVGSPIAGPLGLGAIGLGPIVINPVGGNQGVGTK